jgi:hypothetical protein
VIQSEADEEAFAPFGELIPSGETVG